MMNSLSLQTAEYVKNILVLNVVEESRSSRLPEGSFLWSCSVKVEVRVQANCCDEHVSAYSEVGMM